MPPKFVRNPGSSDIAYARDIEKRSLLDGNSDDEDFFLQGPKVSTSKLRGDGSIGRLNGQVDEVIEIMKDNVNKVFERGDRLEDLQDKSDDLVMHSSMFQSRAKSLQRNMWLKNCKMKIILAVVIIVILAIIIIPIVIQQTQN